MKKFILMLLVLISGVQIAWGANRKSGESAPVDNTAEYYKMINLLRLVENFYVDTLNMHKLVENSIVKTLEQLDPHSVYMSREEAKRANEPLEGNFEGIGIQYQMLRDTLYVIQTISGCPAERVGLHAGDRIIKVDTTNIAGVKKETRDIVKLLRGPKGTEVHVLVLRSGEKDPMEFTIIRDKIPLYSVDASYMVAPGIGYVKINSFGATTHTEFMEAWNKMKAQGAKKLIIDLQDNGGGYLGTATSILDELLPKGRMLVYTQGEHQERDDMKAQKTGELEKVPVCVLVNQYSASASEITAGAIQDWDRGLVIGVRTFGKGLVQRQFPLSDGSFVRLTIARYYTPSGRCIQKPYNGSDYGDDMEERYEHGEWVNADSIHFNDSLKYTTLVKHRTVYGGGGIMPDIFIPMDTTLNYSYWNRLSAKNIVNQTITDYIEDHRDELKTQYPGIEQFQTNFNTPVELLEQIVKKGDEQNVKRDDAHWEAFKPKALHLMKALIARDLWTMQEYYQIDNEQDKALIRAIEELSK